MSDAQQPFAPLVETGTVDSTALEGMKIKIPSAANFADDTDVQNYCKDILYPIVTRVKQRRRLLEDEWLAIGRLNTLTHDGGQKYKGRSNVYMPTYAQASATILSQLSRGLFPSDDYMDVEAHDSSADDESQQVKQIIQYEFDCNARIRQRIKPALKQLIDTGNGVVKYGIRTGKEFQGKKEKDGAVFKQHPQKGLWISARSVHNVVVYPETAEGEDDILITAEYIDTDRNYAIHLGKTKRWVNVDDALATANVADLSQYSRDQSIMDQSKIPGMLENVDSSDPREPTAQQITLIECYVSMRLPKAAYVEGEDPTLPIPARVVMCKGIALEVTRNPEYAQKHPYLWMRQGVIPGSFYGSWAGRRARYLQYQINDFANQTNDTGILGLNPFMVVDTNLLTGPLLPMAPGRVYRTRDAKNAITFNHPPMEPIQYGQQLLSLYIGALMDNTGAPPVLQGVGKGASTATEQSILQRNSLSPLQDVIEDIEAQMMIPLMERTWRLVVQFSDRDLTVIQPDGTPKQVEVSDLDSFEYNFKFLASSQAENKQVQGQQALQLLQGLNPFMVQLLQANQVGVNPMELYKKMWGAHGWRQFDKFMFKIPPPMMMPGQGPGMPGQPQPGQPPAQEGGGAIPQGQQPAPQMPMGPNNNAPGAGANVAPQDAADFQHVRAITDEINAMKQGKGRG